MAPMKCESAGHRQEVSGTMSLTRLAQRWHTSRKNIRQLLSHGFLNFVQIRGHLRVPENEVRRYEKEHTPDEPHQA